ncbi:hypothetical protein pmac_cds_612 [Pandoravirus macleodensis]|uniref:Uncharacterized protein n=1 Tax=Pandoravirus macleodensis TaxID=2107707 RepID=A0A2U7UG47_9VIRU|nr:hypothetical protein pmac_cds_612 [Pandoravirus macleodensis]AVK77300.1 hypothetical protein pmac_cds_612 [Pandoravirus macleodensis]
MNYPQRGAPPSRAIWPVRAAAPVIPIMRGARPGVVAASRSTPLGSATGRPGSAVGDVASASTTSLPIYAEAVGPLKAIGYVEEGRLTPAQVERVRRAGNATDGKYVWNSDALGRLLALNAHLFDGSVDDFVRIVRGREPIDDPHLLCLIHAAFLDHRTYAAQPCTASALILPEAVGAYMDAALAYGDALTPEDAWVVPLVAAPAQWPRLFALLGRFQHQIDDCRRTLYGRTAPL